MSVGVLQDVAVSFIYEIIIIIIVLKNDCKMTTGVIKPTEIDYYN